MFFMYSFSIIIFLLDCKFYYMNFLFIRNKFFAENLLSTIEIKERFLMVFPVSSIGAEQPALFVFTQKSPAPN